MAIDPNNLSGTARLTFAEEFNNLSLWNGTSGTWATNYNFNGQNISTLSGNGELQWYVEANDPNLAAVDPWKVNNGILTISAAQADPSIKPYIDNYNYTSGLLTSQNSFSQLYGYFEMSAKLPAGQGLWPAFWMLPTNGSWRPELDILEYLGSDTHSFWQFSHPADQTYDRYFNTPTAGDLSTSFHRYGMDWEADKITFYFDGQVTGVAPTAPEMNQAMYLLVNLALGGSWAGPPNASTVFPANLQVDYIRAYQSLTTPTFTNLVISPASQSAAEGSNPGNTLTYTINRTGDLTGATSVNWSVAGAGANPVNGADFVGGALPGGTVNFAAGQNAATVTINLSGDTTVEPDEGFTVNLSNPVGGTITGGPASGTILNDDGAMTTSLSISPATISLSEGQSGTTWFVYTVTRSGAVAGPSSANFAVNGTGPNPAAASDFVGGTFASGTLFFGGGETTKNIWIQVAGDTTVEPNETFAVTLTSASGATIVDSTAQGVIVNDDGAAQPPTLTLSPANLSQAEGASGAKAFSFTVTRSGDLTGASSAAWSVAGSGANAANAADFTGGQLPSGTVNFAAGASTATVTVNVAGDTTVEPDEAFTVTLNNPSGATLGAASAQGVILNDDSSPLPSLAIGPASVSHSEGASGSTAYAFTVTRSGDLTGASSAAWSVAGSGANAANAADFTGGQLPSGTVNFAAGASTATVTVNVAGDATVESDETFTVTLASPTGATLGTTSAQGVIVNDDSSPLPSLAIGPASVSHSEGASGSTAYAFTVTRSGDLTGASSAAWSVAGSGANAANAADFTGGQLPSGTVNFAAGASTATVTVNVAGDATVEPDETFTVTLASPTGATIGAASTQGVIVNDDTGTPTQGGTGTAGDDLFVLSPASNLNITGYDAAGQDALGIPIGAGGFSLAAYSGQPSLTIVDAAAWWSNISGAQVVRWNGDASAVDTAAKVDGLLQAMPGNGGGGVLFVAGGPGNAVSVYYDSAPSQAGGASLVATLNGVANPAALNASDFRPSSATPAGPTLSMQAATVALNEGNSGTTAFQFTVARTGDLSGTASATWTVAGGMPGTPAGSLEDYSAEANDFSGGAYPTGTVNFAAGQSTALITVNVVGDTTPESDQGFGVTLSNLAGASAGSNLTAYGNIINDDGGRIAFQSAPTSLAEGNSGLTAFTYTLARSAGSTGTATVAWSVSGGTANSGDFIGGALPSGTATFAAGQTTAQFTVQVVGDTAVESNETFTVSLGAATNGFLDLGQQSRTSTILNDDGASGGGGGVGTAGNDVFNLTPGSTVAISGYDQAGADALGVPTGAGGFSLAGYAAGQTQLVMVDAIAWWSNIGGAQVVRWVGDLTAVDTASEVDALLEAMPGNAGGGRLFIGGAAGGGLGVYYDPNPQVRGDATLVATISNLNDPHSLVVADFQIF